jgi:hypothetical protein
MQPEMEVGGTLAMGLFLLMVGGGLIWLVGHVWLLIRAFQEGPGWGLAVLLLPGLADLFFSIDHWLIAKKPFWLSVAGAVFMLIPYGASAMLGGRLHRAEAPPLAAPVKAEAVANSPLEKEAGIPATDREKVADILQSAGIDPDNPRTFEKRTIKQMTEALGAPSATLKVGGEINYIFYNCFEVVSTDGGKTVSAVHYMGK